MNIFRLNEIKRWTVPFVLLFFLVSPVLFCSAQEKEPEYAGLEVIAKNLTYPVDVTDPGDGTGRLFIVERPGRIKVYDREEEKVLDEVFLDIRDHVVTGRSLATEMGLLSVVFHPNFKSNQKFYVNYTSKRNGKRQTIVSEWKTNEKRTQVKDGSERILMAIDQPWGNHNGGQIRFGPEGYLYIGMGDGGYANDPRNNAQDKSTLLGAMLRIDVNNREGDRPYAIPDDNPFVDDDNARPEIFAYGLRNPWRFSFDRKTGTLWAGDVGQNDWEEVDIIEKGKNYGWRIKEGKVFNPNIDVKEDDSELTDPVHVYPTGEKGTSVLGGFVYRGDDISELKGTYVFGDYSSGYIWGLDYDGNRVKNHRLLFSTSRILSSFGEDAEGELYVCDLKGRLLKMVPK